MVLIAFTFCFAVGLCLVWCCCFCVTYSVWVLLVDASLVVFGLLLWLGDTGLGLFSFFG